MWVIKPLVEEGRRALPQIIPHKLPRRPKVGVVLSGGGARGVASIGVLRSLEEHSIPIDFIAGTSIGSIVGGLYAAGFSPDELQMMVDTTNWLELLSFTEEARRQDLFVDQKIAEDRSILSLRFDGLEPVIPQALSTGQRLTNYLNLLSFQAIYQAGGSFDDLRTPFRAVTTDLVSGKQVIIDKGNLAEAMRASVTVPLLFSTVRKDTLQLLDGGLVANIPVGVARDWGADIVIAVDVTSPLRPEEKLSAPWEVADQIIGIMAQFANKQELAEADVVIRPAIGNHLSSDFTSLDYLIEQGKESADQAVDQIQSIMETKFGDLFRGGESDRRIRHGGLLRSPSEDASMWEPAIRECLNSDTATAGDLRMLATLIFSTGNYSDVRILVNERGDSSIVELGLTPNPTVFSFSFRGNEEISTDSLLEVVRPMLGKRINYEEENRILESILQCYRDRGLSLARISNASFDSARGMVDLTISEGTVDGRRVSGTTKTKDYVIWRETTFSPGNKFRLSEAAEGLRNLYSTSLFDQVLIDVQQVGPEKRNIIVVKARERSTGLIRFGLKLDNERNLQPLIDIRDSNFLGIASELGAQFFGGPRNRLFLGEFTANRIFDSYLTFSLRGYYDLRDVNVYETKASTNPTIWERNRTGEYRTVKEGVRLAFGTQLERLGFVKVEGRIENQRYWNIFNTPISEDRFGIAALKVGTTIDTQDRFPYPRSGVEMNIFFESAFYRPKRGKGFSKFDLSYELYKTLGTRHTLRPKILFGIGDETLPITEQFSIGGQQNFFGLREDDALGRQLMILSLEYRYRSPFSLFFDTYLKVRYDLGSTWSDPDEIKIKDLKHGIGVTLALDTPIGPAEFSVGRSFFIRQDVLDEPASYGPLLLYFNIGYPL